MSNELSFKILCIDGGGVFGCIPARFLSYIDMKPVEHFDAFGGTSVGGQLILAYAKGYSTYDMDSTFTRMAQRIFKPRPWYQRLNPFGPKYDDTNLNTCLQGLLGTTPLGQLGSKVVVPVFDFANRKPKIYDNMAQSPDLDVPIWEVARRTCSAPTYFEPWKGCLDGGLLANNPAVITALAVKSKYGIPFEQMKILSIGTGVTQWNPVDPDSLKKWSALSWLRPMLNVLTEGNELTTDFAARQLSLAKYAHWNPVQLDEDMDMDDPAVMATCVQKCDIFKKEFIDFYNSF